jgi:hypothetical protein
MAVWDRLKAWLGWAQPPAGPRREREAERLRDRQREVEDAIDRLGFDPQAYAEAEADFWRRRGEGRDRE